MLIDLCIKDLAIVNNLQLSFQAGMTVITGETGAGKSILIDALGLVAGERSSSSVIRNTCSKAQITAYFAIDNLPKAQQFLLSNDLSHPDQDNSCILRRILNKNGPSRCYINDNLVTLNQLKLLGELLLNIHSQHQHQALLQADAQLELLDTYANHTALLNQVNSTYSLWHASKKAYTNLVQLEQELDKLELLKYQLNELQELNLGELELAQLEQQHDKLANAQDLIAAGNIALEQLKLAEHNIYDRTYACHQSMHNLTTKYPELINCRDNLNQALINLEEASQDLTSFLATLDLEPEKLANIEHRLTAIYNLARKHKVPAQDLVTHTSQLCNKLTAYTQLETNLSQAQAEIAQHQANYQVAADKLSLSRQHHAAIFTQQLSKQLKKLSMPNVNFNIDFHTDPNNLSKTGYDKIEFMVSTNPGQPLQALKKIASGGELSRISLAIEVITSDSKTTPTLVFDEVDVGISGEAATVVGTLLKSISQKAQTICITHLPQVAVQGDNHLKVLKQHSANNTTTSIIQLDNNNRTTEIARLLAGANITSEALAHAKEMLSIATV